MCVLFISRRKRGHGFVFQFIIYVKLQAIHEELKPFYGMKKYVFFVILWPFEVDRFIENIGKYKKYREI